MIIKRKAGHLKYNNNNNNNNKAFKSQTSWSRLSRPPEIRTQNQIFQYNTPTNASCCKAKRLTSRHNRSIVKLPKYNKETETKMGTLYTSADVPLSFQYFFLLVAGSIMPQVYYKCGNGKHPIPFLQKEMHHIAFRNKDCTPYTSPVT